MKRTFETVTWQWLSTHSMLLIVLAVIVVGVIVYRPILNFTFFWEDPGEIGEVDSRSNTEIFLASSNNLYYRPFYWLLIKQLKLGQEHFSPYPFFIFNLLSRLAGSLLLFGFARRLTVHSRSAAAAALLFLLSPLPYDSTARAISPHQPLLLPFLLTLWLYLEGRLGKRPLLLGLAMTAEAVSLLVHELGILLPLFILALESFLVFKKIVSKFNKISFVFIVPAIIFLAIWLVIPKGGTLMVFDHALDKVLYLSQSLSFPVAWLISRLGGLGLEPPQQALLALLVTLFILAFFYWREYRLELLFFLFCWLLLCALLWSTLSFDYMWTGSRLLYLPSLMTSLIWGGISLNRQGWLRAVGLALIVLIMLQGAISISKLNSLYRHGSSLMEEIIQVGQRHEKLLYINVPDRFEYRQTLVPIGFWGMVLAPVSQSLADFVFFNYGVATETMSLSNFPLADDMRLDSPYIVYSRGSDAYGTSLLYDSMLWADRVYYVNYSNTGEMDLAGIGDITQPETQGADDGSLASFGQNAELLDIELTAAAGMVTISTTFRALESPGEDVTLFFHLVDASGRLADQADGDALHGLIPPRAWREGNIVNDIRSIPLDDSLENQPLQVRFGFYDRTKGVRLPVESRIYQINEDAVVVPLGL